MDLKKEYIRLVEIVKKYSKENNLPSTNADLAGILGYSRSHFSTLLGKSNPVSEDHIKQLKLNFPEALGNPTSPTPKGHSSSGPLEDLARSSVILAEAHKILADANMVLANNNQNLINRLLSNSDSAKSRTLTPLQIALASAIEKLAEAGAGELWKSKDAGILKLGKLLVGAEFAVPK